MAGLEPAEKEEIGSLRRAPRAAPPPPTPKPAHVAAHTKGKHVSLSWWSPVLALFSSAPVLPTPYLAAHSPLGRPPPSPIELYGRSLCLSSLSTAASLPPTPLATAWVSQDC